MFIRAWFFRYTLIYTSKTHLFGSCIYRDFFAVDFKQMSNCPAALHNHKFPCDICPEHVIITGWVLCSKYDIRSDTLWCSRCARCTLFFHNTKVRALGASMVHGEGQVWHLCEAHRLVHKKQSPVNKIRNIINSAVISSFQTLPHTLPHALR